MDQNTLNVLNKYLAFRQNNDIEGCLSLLAETVILVSEKDGTFKGKSALKNYLELNPYRGRWGSPYWSEKEQMIRVDGQIKILMIPLKVKILAKLNKLYQIDYVKVARA